jgi:hypothetical protein
VAVVVVFVSAPLPALVAATVALGTTEPAGSLTSPVMFPRSFCAVKAAVKKTKVPAAETSRMETSWFYAL